MTSELCWKSAVELAHLVRTRQVSPSEVLDAVLAQVDRVNPALNAIVSRADDDARRQARELEAALVRGEDAGPLAGVPIAVKDLHLTAGVRTTFGSRLYEHFVPNWEQPIVERLRVAGAVLYGKTNASEFGLIPLTDNSIFGPTCNPWNVAHNSGGSSGGATVAVACGCGPLATAGDGGGSIRIPAAFTGVFGLKPQFGRVPHVAFPRGWETLSHQGLVSREVRDTALALDVLAGPDERDRRSLPAPTSKFVDACTADARGLRLAWCPHLGQLPVEPEVLEICRAAAARFEELGCRVDEIELELPELTAAQQQIVLCEAATAVGERRAEWEQLIYPGHRKLLEHADRLTYHDLVRAQWAADEFVEQIAPLWQQYDALLTPTAPITAPENGSLGPREIAGQPRRALSWLCFCVPWNMTGQPAASLPAGRAGNELPVGLQIVGRRFDEATVLRLASAYEAAWPWWRERPPICQ
ncbi:MAG: amidase [Pirellulales bacterium]